MPKKGFTTKKYILEYMLLKILKKKGYLKVKNRKSTKINRNCIEKWISFLQVFLKNGYSNTQKGSIESIILNSFWYAK